jgi:hypothetical protein
MDTKPTVLLPRDVIERCDRHAAQMVADYRAGRNAASLAVSTHGMQFNAAGQAHAKKGECAFAIWLGLPLDVLHWGRDCDDGSDVTFFTAQIDVKATQPRGRFLIWPIGKRHIFDSKRFNMLALVKGDGECFTIAGFVEKSDFALWHHVWNEPHGLQAGTWFMREEELVPPHLLKPYVGILA